MLADILFLLLAAVLIVPLFQRIGLGSVLGYLAAGLVVGPSVFGVVENIEEVAHIGEMGVVFLLFVIGLELKPQRLWTMRHLVFGMGLSQVLVTGAILSLAAYMLGTNVETSIIIGLGLALSSTAFVLQLLAERGELPTKEGRASFGVLLFQDIAVVPLLLMIQAFSLSSGRVTSDIGLGLVQGFGALAIVIVVGRYGVRPLLRHIAAAGNHEVFAATAVLIVIGTGWLMESAGLSMALGAFLAGVLLSGSEFRHQITADVEHFRGLLLGLFFMVVGMSINLIHLGNNWLLIVGLVIALMAIKFMIIYPLARLFRHNNIQALRIAFYLSQAGEFGFVLFALANKYHLLSVNHYSLLTSIIVVSMVITPLMFTLAYRLTKTAEVTDVPDEKHIDKARLTGNPVLIAGFGRFGEQVAKVLRAGGIPYIAVDNNPAVVIKAHAQSLPVYYGDVSRPNVLRQLGAERARLAVVTLDQPLAIERTISALHNECPKVPIFARTHGGEDSERLHSLGVETTVPETLESSLQLAATILFRLGVQENNVNELINEFRDEDYLRLRMAEQHEQSGEPT